MNSLYPPRLITSIFACLFFLPSAPALATPLTFDIDPVSLFFELDLEGETTEPGVSGVLIEAAAVTATAGLGEEVTLQQDFTVTFSGDLNDPSWFFQTFIEPQIFTPGLNPLIEAETVEFLQTIRLNGGDLFQFATGLTSFAVYQDDLIFDRTTELLVLPPDFVSPGLIDTFIFEAIFLATEVSGPQVSAVGSGPLTFSASHRFRIDSIEPIPMPIPEPSSMSLMLVALTGVFFYRRRVAYRCEPA